MKILICFFMTVNFIFAFPGSDYKEPASVKKYFPATPLVVSTPSIAPGRSTFTTQREMLDYLGAIHTHNSSTVVNLLGPTRGNNYLPVFVLSRGKELTFQNTTNGKPTIMLIAQQHGDEPMGCDVLMGTVKRVAQGGMNYLLDKVNIVIMPRINPDGAANFTRVARRNVDINDDHQNYYTVEASAVSNMYDLFNPEVFVDLHEYIADKECYSDIIAGGAVPYYDLLVLSPTNSNYPKNLNDYSKHTLIKLRDELGKSDYHADYYYNPFIKPKHGQPLILYRATSDKNLARNAYGLKGSLSFLMELRGRDIGFENVERRLNTGLAAVQLLLERVYFRNDEVKNLVATERQNIGGGSGKLVLVENNVTLPLVNIETGALENTPAVLVKQKN